MHTRLESPTWGYNFVFRLLDAVVVRPWLLLARPTFVVMDQPMQEYIRAATDPGCPRPRQSPWASTSPMSTPPRTARQIRAELDIGERPMILSVGHVIQMRDRVDLIEALPAALRQQPDLAVVVVGAVHYPRFLELADELGVRDHVFSTGAQPRDKMPAYLDAADLEIHELQGYGMGTATLEAMAAEVPVIVAVRADNFPGIALARRRERHPDPPPRSGRARRGDRQAAQ